MKSTTFKIKNCDFDENEADLKGGAISAFAKSQGDIETTTFDLNRATNGGAIYMDDSIVDMRQAKFLNNSGGSSGGALDLSANSLMKLKECTFLENICLGNGGDINSKDSELSIDNTGFESIFRYI